MMLHGSHTLEEIVSEKVVDPMDALIFRRTKAAELYNRIDESVPIVCFY